MTQAMTMLQKMSAVLRVSLPRPWKIVYTRAGNVSGVDPEFLECVLGDGKVEFSCPMNEAPKLGDVTGSGDEFQKGVEIIKGVAKTAGIAV